MALSFQQSKLSNLEFILDTLSADNGDDKHIKEIKSEITKQKNLVSISAKNDMKMKNIRKSKK